MVIKNMTEKNNILLWHDRFAQRFWFDKNRITTLNARSAPPFHAVGSVRNRSFAIIKLIIFHVWQILILVTFYNNFTQNGQSHQIHTDYKHDIKFSAHHSQENVK